MSDENTALDFEGQEADDLYPFSWEKVNEDVANAEIQAMTSAIFNVSKLVSHMCTGNDYENTAVAYQKLWTQQLGRTSWVQEYYYANRDTFEKYLRGDSRPTEYHSYSYEKKKAFDFGLDLQKDASQLSKPIDQMISLMRNIPLLSTFRIVRLTMTLDENGFDQEFFDMMNNDLEDVSDLLNKTLEGLDRTCAQNAKQFLKDNRGKMSDDDLQDRYLDARRKDYISAFKAYCAKSVYDFRPDEHGRFILTGSQNFLGRFTL